MTNKFFYSFYLTAISLIPVVSASAQGLGDGDVTGGAFGGFLGNILQFSNNVLIPFIIGIGFLVFVWGMFQYFIAGGANDDAKEKGKSLMIWAVIGFVLMFILWGIVNILVSSSGFNEGIANPLPKAPLPA